MQVQWTKLIWEIVIVAIVVLSVSNLVTRHWHKEVPPPPPVVVMTPELAPAPPLVAPPPKPVFRPKPKPAFDCKKLPAVAYQVDIGTVLETMRERGATPAQIAAVERCIRHGSR